MGQYVLRRGLATAVMLWVIATILFFFVHLLPGDVAEIILGGGEFFQPTEEQIEALRRQLGLDRPLHQQYLEYIAGLLRGDMGQSFLTGRPVAADLWLRFGRTLQLVLPAIALASLLGVALGVAAATRRGRWLDGFFSALGVLGHSLPTFVVGNLLILAFSLRWRLLPSSGFIEFTTDPVASIKHMVLPLITLVVSRIGSIMRMTRMSMVEQLGADYVRTARAKGLTERKIVYRHVLKNASIPVVTVIGLQLGSLVAGGMVVEAVFNWPGLSTILLRAVTNRDYPLIQGSVLFIATVYTVTTFLTDITYAYLNPRIRYA